MSDEQRGDGRATPELNPDDTATVATILVEVRDTAPTGTRTQVAEMIRSRLKRAGISLADSEVDSLSAQVLEGDE